MAAADLYQRDYCDSAIDSGCGRTIPDRYLAEQQCKRQGNSKQITSGSGSGSDSSSGSGSEILNRQLVVAAGAAVVAEYRK